MMGATRRDVLRILAVGGAAGMAWKLGLFRHTGMQRADRSRPLMGTQVNLTILGEDRDAAQQAADATLDRMSELESLLSRYRPDSEVSRLNAEGRIEGASDALLDVLELAGRISRLGDGAFDITVQPVLDLYRGHLRDRRGLPTGEALERAVASVGHRGVRIEDETVTLDRSDMLITLDGIGKGYVVDRGVAVLSERGFPVSYWRTCPAARATSSPRTST